MSKSLTKTTEQQWSLRPTSLTEAMEFAKLIASSSIVPDAMRNKPGDVMVAVQMGAELGLPPIQSLQNIAVINGRPSVWGDAALALVRGHADCLDVIETYDAGTQMATCDVRRRGCQPCVRTFSKDDAQQAGLWGRKGPWTQYTQRMLQMRARGFALRDSFPDALRGIITAEEARDIPPRTIDSAEPLGHPPKTHTPTTHPPTTQKPKQGDDEVWEIIASISAAQSKDEVRKIYRAHKGNAVISDACKARADEMDAEVAAFKAELGREPSPPHDDETGEVAGGIEQVRLALGGGHE